MRYAITFAAFLSLFLSGAAGSQPVNEGLPSKAVPSGKMMYNEYCAECHGPEGKGDGPYAAMLKVQPRI